VLWWKLRQIRSSNGAVRQRAVEKLSKSPDDRALRALLESLDDRDEQVQMAAAMALQNRKSPAIFVPALPVLMRQCESTNPSFAETARTALRELRDRLAGSHICPRCGGTSYTSGHRSGWTCQGCRLNQVAAGPPSWGQHDLSETLRLLLDGRVEWKANWDTFLLHWNLYGRLG
jgi:ribosomal protein L37AE/L43A